MAQITFNRFDLGIDLRKGASVSDANRLRAMSNAYVTTGLATKKRPGLKHVATLPSGTVGLAGALGKLQVFSTAAVSVDTSLFQDNVIAYSGKTLKDVPFCEVFNGYLYTVAEYTDGTVRHFYNNSVITDGNCPHTKVVAKLASKIFAASAAGDTVRFCATGKPTDWSSEKDAGFLPTGLDATGDRTACALGIYRTQLVVIMRDGCQIWTVDADPSAMSLADRVDNVGTSYPRSVAAVSGDLYFLSDFGFRSISLQAYTNNLIDVDVGSPIDSLVRDALANRGTEEPKAFYFYGTGQYVCIFGSRCFVYSVSRTAKISAWSQYFFSVPIDAVAQLGQTLYLRSGDEVYKLDAESHTDAGQQYEVLLDLPYMDFKKPGTLKHVWGMDIVCEGECEVSLGFDPRDHEAYTPALRVSGNTRPGGIIPVECCGTEIAPRIYVYNDKEFQLDAITLYYDDLGAV